MYMYVYVYVYMYIYVCVSMFLYVGIVYIYQCIYIISPAPGCSSKLTHPGVEIDASAFQTGC